MSSIRNKNSYSKLEQQKSIFFLLLFYILCSFCSFIYALTQGVYNGDYYGVHVGLNFSELLFVFLLNILPYIVVYSFYKGFAKVKTIKVIRVRQKSFIILSVSLLLLYLFLVIIFGVGKAGYQYKASPLITILIQIIYRISPMSIGYLCILFTMKNNKFYTFILIVLIAIIGVFQHFTGWIFTLGTIIYLLYFNFWYKLAKRFPIAIIILISFSILIIYYTYRAKDFLRTGLFTTNFGLEEIKNLIFNRFVGRLSSFSNSGIFLDRKEYFIEVLPEFDNFWFQKEFISVISSKFLPEHILPKVMTFDESAMSSVMISPAGIIIFSYYKSFISSILNSLCLLLFCYAYLKFFLYLNNEYSLEFGTINLYVMMMGGNGYNLGQQMVFIILFFFIILFLNFLICPFSSTQGGKYE